MLLSLLQVREEIAASVLSAMATSGDGGGRTYLTGGVGRLNKNLSSSSVYSSCANWVTPIEFQSANSIRKIWTRGPLCMGRRSCKIAGRKCDNNWGGLKLVDFYLFLTAGLVVAGLGFMGDTYIYLSGFQIYGGELRLRPFTNLYPHLITKEDLLSPDELATFKNFSSQLAALDFIACATSDVFAITDSGSQLSSHFCKVHVLGDVSHCDPLALCL